MKICTSHKMLLLRPLGNHFLVASTITMFLMTKVVLTRPQDSNIFENVASKALVVAGNAAEMVGNAGMSISKKTGFELPFAKANSDTELGTGAAMRTEEDSSEEDRRRRKRRSLDLALIDHDLLGEESLLPVPHVYRDKRSPCHYGTTGGGSGGGGTDVPVDGGDLDITERRRRAYARRRKAAAQKKANTARKTTRKNNSRRTNKYLVNSDDDVNQALTRRKRQSELDDLNQNMSNASKDFSQQAQQIAEKIRSAWENFMNSINDMAQRIKQHFNGQNSTDSASEEI